MRLFDFSMFDARFLDVRCSISRCSMLDARFLDAGISHRAMQTFRIERCKHLASSDAGISHRAMQAFRIERCRHLAPSDAGRLRPINDEQTKENNLTGLRNLLGLAASSFRIASSYILSMTTNQQTNKSTNEQLNK